MLLFCKSQGWYKTTDGTLQYDPKIKSKKDVGEGQTYVGKTYREQTENGIVNYRRDGSIMYSNQTDAYNRIVSNSTEGTTHEESAAILRNCVLVFPSYGNNSTTADPGKYGYKFEGGDLVDALDGKIKELVAMVHTHPDKAGAAGPSIYTAGPSDVRWQARNIPGKMGFVFGYNEKLYGLRAWPNPGAPNSYTKYNFTDENKVIVRDVLGGKVDLRNAAYPFFKNPTR